MTTAEIISIGTELLLGEIQDTNTRYMALRLREMGIDLYRVTIVGDNAMRIADAIRESLARADIVITTGGLGPTVDDPTRSAVALAFNVDVVFHSELWDQIRSRFINRGYHPSENNKKQAFLPESAIAIENPVGTAPAFYIERANKIVISLPGVPAEMETIFSKSLAPLVQQFFHLNEIIKTRVLHTIGIGESALDALISDLETGGNPTVGLSAHPASVDIRITAKSQSESQAENMITAIEMEIRSRIPDVIFGQDQETIQSILAALAIEREYAVQIHWHAPLSIDHFPNERIHYDEIQFIRSPLPLSAANLSLPDERTIQLGVNLYQDGDQTGLELINTSMTLPGTKEYRFLGPVGLFPAWALNTVYNYIWLQFKSRKQESK